MSKDLPTLQKDFITVIKMDCENGGFENTRRFLETTEQNKNVLNVCTTSFSSHHRLCSALEYVAQRDNLPLIDFLLSQGAISGAKEAVQEIMGRHGDDLIGAQSLCGSMVEGFKAVTVGSRVWDAQNALSALLMVDHNPTIYNSDHKDYIERMLEQQRPSTTFSSPTTGQTAELGDKKFR